MASALLPPISEQEQRTVIHRPQGATEHFYELSSPAGRFGEFYSAMVTLTPIAALAPVQAAWRQLIAAAAESAAQKTVYISTFAPEPYEITKPIAVHLQTEGSNVIATFFDANLSTAGETEEEAYANLRSLILDVFDSLEAEPVSKLGSEPTRQLAVLRNFLRLA